MAEIEALGVVLKHVDLGGGFGIEYNAEQAPHFDQYAEVLGPFFADRRHRLIL